jgi:hypothetical protein
MRPPRGPDAGAGLTRRFGFVGLEAPLRTIEFLCRGEFFERLIKGRFRFRGLRLRLPIFGSKLGVIGFELEHHLVNVADVRRLRMKPGRMGDERGGSDAYEKLDFQAGILRACADGRRRGRGLLQQ